MREGSIEDYKTGWEAVGYRLAEMPGFSEEFDGYQKGIKRLESVDLETAERLKRRFQELAQQILDARFEMKKLGEDIVAAE